MLTLSLLLCLPAASAAEWLALGPEGGDVRRLTQDPSNPDRILLGTSAGQLYHSEDAGRSWTRLARLGGYDFVLDNIVFHPFVPELAYVGAWSLENDGGGLYRSRDGGRTWELLPGTQGKSIRSVALAETDSYVVAVGTLEGVFLSRDRGDAWERISPEGHPDIKNVGSLAIDPRSPHIIYAGTWHLPWKTMNGGATWEPIHNGLIDDSDIMSIVIDPATPSQVYVSACSGIYKSADGGARFRKLPGIPFAARRTRVLKQVPGDRTTLYAGTTEGLWKSGDGGESWRRVTAGGLIVNDIAIDPRETARVLLGTERAGVLRSEDAGQRFAASNRGFTHRLTAAVLVDREHPQRLYISVLNDKEFGGVFVSDDLGGSWRQMNDGLGSADVFTLEQGEDGTLLAGTSRGVFAMGRGQRRWEARNTVLRGPAKAQLGSRVFQLETAPGQWLAATATGLYASRDQARTWSPVATDGLTEVIAVRAAGELMVAAGRRTVLVSQDGGATWNASTLPDFLLKIYGLSIAGDQAIWLATREGAFRSRDYGRSWERILGGLPARFVNSIVWDAAGQRLLATSSSSPHLFQSRDGGDRWQPMSTGAALRAAATSRGRLLAATAFDGLIVEPPLVTAQDADPVRESDGCEGGGC